MPDEMTFDDANDIDYSVEMVDAFDIEAHEAICGGCIHEFECRAIEAFHNEYPSDSIAKCKFYEEY